MANKQKSIQLDQSLLDRQGFVRANGKLKVRGKKKLVFEFNPVADNSYNFQASNIDAGENVKLALKSNFGILLSQSKDSPGSKDAHLSYKFKTSEPIKVIVSTQKDRKNKGAIPFNLSVTHQDVQRSIPYKKIINDGTLNENELLALSSYGNIDIDYTIRNDNGVTELWSRLDGNITLENLDNLLEASVIDDGILSKDEIQSLESIHQKLPDRVESEKLDYYSYIFGSAIGDNPANKLYTGGVKKRSQRIPLNNLEEGSDSDHVNMMRDKWFKGNDLPLAYMDGDSASKTPPSSFNYAEASGELFRGEPNFTQVAQGGAGTCWFEAALNAVANSENEKEHLTNMFIDNGNGTFGVKFYAPRGSKETAWVTVNRELPIKKNMDYSLLMTSSYISPQLDRATGYRVKPRISLTGYGEASLLWAALAEKALAQVNETGLLRRSSKENSYAAIEGGLAKGFDYLTGNIGYTSEDYYPPLKYDDFAGIDPTEDLLMLGSNIKWGGRGKTKLVPGHMYTIIDYDSDTDSYQVANPWGQSAFDYDPVFSMSGREIERLLNMGAIDLSASVERDLWDSVM